MRSIVTEYEIQEQISPKVLTSLDDLAGTSFYKQCQMLVEWTERFDWLGLVNELKKFDNAQIGKIKIYHLINVLKFNLKVFSEDTLKNLQFDLECLNNDGMVDYEELVSIAFGRKVKEIDDDIHLPGHLSER